MQRRPHEGSVQISPNPLEHTYKLIIAAGGGVAVMLLELGYLIFFKQNVNLGEGLFRVITPALLGIIEAQRQWFLEDQAWKVRDFNRYRLR